jgi:AmiR/NasT family two-component response regulator
MAAALPHQADLAVLVVDELPGPLEHASRLVEAAGHHVVAAATDLGGALSALAKHRLDAMVVAMHEDREHALQLIEAVATRSGCAVVLLFDRDDPLLVRDALDRGAAAYADRETLGSLESAMTLARRRQAEVGDLSSQIRDLEGGAARRALIERAKGVVMERHGVEERTAYEMLRRQARSSRTTLAHVAEAVLDARALF